MPGMDIRAALTVVGDGPVGAVGRQLDEDFGLPHGHHHREWAVGMKMVVDLPEDCTLGARHGVPHVRLSGAGDFWLPVRASRRVATVGIFVPSWFRSPVRTSYRYLQHFLLHPVSLALSARAANCVPGARSRCRNPAGAASRCWRAMATRVLARVRAAPTCSPVRAWMRPGPRAATGGSGARTAARGETVHSREPGAGVRRAAALQLGGRRRPRGRKGARRIPSRGGHRADRHGLGGSHQRQILASAANPDRCRNSRTITAARFRPRNWSGSWRSAARVELRVTTRSWSAAAGRRFPTTANCWLRTRTRC